MQNEIQTVHQAETQPEVQTTNCEATNGVKCLNCGTEFEGNFCPECGQSADTGRFTMKFIWENLLAAFTSKDGGIWFTLKNLFTRPGAMVVEILNGKRRSYFSPFPMLFFALTIYILLFSITGSHGDIQQMEKEYLEMEKEDKQTADTAIMDLQMNEKEITVRKSKIFKIVGKGFKFYNNHYTTIFMLTIPFFLFATRAWYGKNNRKRYYRAEYLVAIAYSMVMVVLYRCLASVAYFFSKSFSDTMSNLIPFVIALAFTACFQKMLGFSFTKTAWRSLLAVVLYYIVLGFFLTAIGLLVFVVLVKY